MTGSVSSPAANRIGEIIAGKRGISAETALRLGHYFGTGVAFWMNLQSQFDLAVAIRDVGERVGRKVGVAAQDARRACSRPGYFANSRYYLPRVSQPFCSPPRLPVSKPMLPTSR